MNLKILGLKSSRLRANCCGTRRTAGKLKDLTLMELAVESGARYRLATQQMPLPFWSVTGFSSMACPSS